MLLALARTHAWALAALVAGCLMLLARSGPLSPHPLHAGSSAVVSALLRAEQAAVANAGLSGPLPIPMDQGAIIVSNHRAGVDPLFIAMTTPRPVHWMVAREYCELWTVGWGFRILQAIPTNRAGIDTASTRMAIRLAQQGELVGVLPEGRINRERDLAAARPSGRGADRAEGPRAGDSLLHPRRTDEGEPLQLIHDASPRARGSRPGRSTCRPGTTGPTIARHTRRSRGCC